MLRLHCRRQTQSVLGRTMCKPTHKQSHLTGWSIRASCKDNQCLVEQCAISYTSRHNRGGGSARQQQGRGESSILVMNAYHHMIHHMIHHTIQYHHTMDPSQSSAGNLVPEQWPRADEETLLQQLCGLLRVATCCLQNGPVCQHQGQGWVTVPQALPQCLLSLFVQTVCFVQPVTAREGTNQQAYKQQRVLHALLLHQQI